jgi:hypothetical protein
MLNVRSFCTVSAFPEDEQATNTAITTIHAGTLDEIPTHSG